jgi:hypothetical protein
VTASELFLLLLMLLQPAPFLLWWPLVLMLLRLKSLLLPGFVLVFLLLLFISVFPVSLSLPLLLLPLVLLPWGRVRLPFVCSFALLFCRPLFNTSGCSHCCSHPALLRAT